jgi:hypothetical protein
VITASEFQFPAASNSVDVCFAASVVTHFEEPDVRHYLGEVARVLTGEGNSEYS